MNGKMSEENVISNVEDNSPKNQGVVEKVIEIFKNGWNKQVILYGPPGTSKTYSATIIAAKLLAGSDRVDTQNPYNSAQELLKNEYKDNYKIVQFHPSYSYEDFVRGITVKPAKRNNGITYVTESKIFEKFCKQAQGNKKQKYVLIIDEINRAPLASVLGELIYGLEYRESSIATPYGEEIEGSWIDKNVGIKAKKLYDKLMNEEDGIFSKEYLEDQDMDVNDIKIGHTYFLGRKNEAVEDEKGYLEYRIEYQIKPIYEEYIKDGIIKRDGLKKFDEILKKLELKRSAQKNEQDEDDQ